MMGSEFVSNRLLNVLVDDETDASTGFGGLTSTRGGSNTALGDLCGLGCE